MYFLVLSLFMLLSLTCLANLPGSDIQFVSSFTVLSSSKYGSKLYSIDAPNSVYEDAPLLLDLTPNKPFEQGFDAGYLTGHKFVENYDSLMTALFGNNTALADILG
jgi:hypothetical protein